MDIEQLRAFLAVVETGSFQTAARASKMSRATLRRRIDELEARAGTRLLDRTRNGALVTEAGEVLAKRGRLLIQEVSALLQSIREVGSDPTGVLRVVLPVGLPPHLLTPLFLLLRSNYPRLTFHLNFSDNPMAELLDDVDLAVHFGPPTSEGPWISLEVVRIRVWLLAHVEYLARRGTPKDVGDLANHDLLVWQMPGTRGTTLPLLKGGTYPVQPLIVAADIHLLRQQVLAGVGMGLLPDAMLPDPGVDPNKITPVLAETIGGTVPVQIVVPTVLAEIPKIRAVLNLARSFSRNQVKPA